MKTNFLQIETAMKSRLAPSLESLNQCRSHCVGFEAEDDIFENSSTQFLQLQKNQLTDLQEQFEGYCNTLPVFQSNCVRYDFNFIWSHLLPVRLNKRDFEPIAIKKANQTFPFISGNVLILGLLIFIGGATNLDSFLKTQKTSENLRIFSIRKFNHPEKLNSKEFHPYDDFHNKLQNCNLLEKKNLEKNLSWSK